MISEIEDLGELKINLDNPLKDDRQAKNTHHGRPIHSKKLQTRRADSDSFSCMYCYFKEETIKTFLYLC